MSILSVYHQSTPDTPNKVLTHADDIATTLAEQCVRFEQREVTQSIRPGTVEAEVTASLGEQIQAMRSEFCATVLEVLSVNPEHPQKEELRAGLIDERTHASDDVRFFVSGRGLVNIRIGEYVYGLIGERGDLLIVPAGVAQWFDIGEQPNLVLVRFLSKEGERARLTGDKGSLDYPGLDDTF
ncbi:acireductone dioxygenase [Pseudomonas putida CSV86]|uniref:Acireductone dioxygenase n=1 Tax=Pseudomonas bharatica CSV86 TaxID=1005395 RepID=L1M8G0_9PSED|nr:ARD/ARD' family protein [Pseudomonas bharatica]NNJ14403.1 acireductone dioxygenase [Pseudomonas bharatica CSV86]